MLVGRIPVAVFGDLYDVPGTTELLGTKALRHPALHLCDVPTLRSRDEDALDAQGAEFLGHFRTSRRVQRRSCHMERLSPEALALRTVVTAFEVVRIVVELEGDPVCVMCD